MVLTKAAATAYRVADALNELYGHLAHYPVDVRGSHVRMYYVTAEIDGPELVRCTPQGYAAILRRVTAAAYGDFLRTVTRDLGESEAWVRAFGKLVWQDRSSLIIGGQLFLATLYVDVGGFDPMPVV